MNENNNINNQSNVDQITKGIVDFLLQLSNNLAHSTISGSLANMGDSVSGGMPIGGLEENASSIDSLAVLNECLQASTQVIEKYKSQNLSDELLSSYILEGIKDVVNRYEDKPDNRGCLALLFSGFTDNPEVKHKFAKNLYETWVNLRQNLISNAQMQNGDKKTE